jgi:probable rRNA maturation factor
MTPEINFFTENIRYTVRKKGMLRRWILNTIEREGKVPGDINYIFCDDVYLSELNSKYLKHNSLTDILTFPADEENGSICGDIFISLPRIKENAVKFKQKAEDELHRVMIHGILHLAGYDDSTKSEKEIMTARENLYLSLLSSQ